jgi:uncharacterized protein
MHLSDIRIYPVKSLAGFSLNDALVTRFGLQSDRMLMLVDEDGIFISQRKYPQLALLQTQLDAHAVQVSSPGRGAIKIDVTQFNGNAVAVEVWGDRCYGRVAIPSVNQWFSDFLGFSVRLISYDQQKARASDPKYSKLNDVVSFADGFPLLVISEASLEDLNSRLDKAVSMASFRPNLVVSGCEAYAEDTWTQLKIGEVEFAAVKTCSRCVLTTVDPLTGEKRADGEPLKTLSRYRRAPGGVMFGMNLIPRSTGQIRVNDRVEIIRA